MHLHSEILLRNKKELTANTCNNIGEFHKQCAKSKKLGAWVLFIIAMGCDSIYVKLLKKQYCRVTNSRSLVIKDQELWDKGISCKGMWGGFLEYIFTVMVVTGICIFKPYSSLHLRLVNIILNSVSITIMEIINSLYLK